MFSWIVTYIRPLKFSIATMISIGVIRVAATLMFVYASKSVIDIATGVSNSSFLLWATIMAAAMTTEIILGAMNSKIEKISSQKLQNILRRNLFERLIGMVWQGREGRHSGDTMNRIERDVRDVADFSCSEFPGFIVTGVQFCSAFIFLLVLDARLGWLLVGIVPLFLVASKLWYVRLKTLTHDVRRSDSQIQAYMQESIQKHIVIKTHRAEAYRESQLNGLQDMLLGQTLRQTRFSFYSRLVLSFGFACGYLLTFLYGAWQISQGAISYGVMVAFLQLVAQIQRPVAQMAAAVPRFTAASTAAERLGELSVIDTESKNDRVVLKGPCGLKIDHISFRYDTNEKMIFDNFSHHFAPTSRTMITGETGAGKTSLLRLIMGLVKALHGSMTIYSSNGTQCEISSATRSNFIYVPQGNSLLSGTVRDNLLLANPKADQTEIRKALHTAVAEFAYDLPNGLETECTESAGVLSEGQAQRIAVARALLGSGSVMLFDEFTSALDAQTEREMMSRLMTNYTEKTMIFITHRTQVLENSGFEECRIENLDQ